MSKLIVGVSAFMLISGSAEASGEQVKVDKHGWVEDETVVEITPNGTKSDIFSERPDRTAVTITLSKSTRHELNQKSQTEVAKK